LPQHLEIKSGDSHLIVWKIAEPIDFFVEKLTNWQNHFHAIKSEKRKLQFAASRYIAALLTNIFDASQFANAEDRRPFIKNFDLQISISHDENWVAVIVSKNKVGIDIFCPTQKVFRVAHKFLSENEIAFLENYFSNENEKLKRYSMMWCVKETVFKWMGKDGVEFKEDMLLQKIESAEIFMSTAFYGNVKVQTKFEIEFCLSWM
jgi:phosphopantetheinyl transferase